MSTPVTTMAKDELKAEIRGLIDRCDSSREQQAVQSVLLGLLASMYSGRELALMNHAAAFAENEIKRMTAIRICRNESYTKER